MDPSPLFGLRILRWLFPRLCAAIMLGLLMYEPTRTWLLELWTDRAERRIERALDRLLDALPQVQPTPSPSPAP
jgi:hypothetical protein